LVQGYKAVEITTERAVDVLESVGACQTLDLGVAMITLSTQEDGKLLAVITGVNGRAAALGLSEVVDSL
jgi:hypothetical protein